MGTGLDSEARGSRLVESYFLRAEDLQSQVIGDMITKMEEHKAPKDACG